MWNRLIAVVEEQAQSLARTVAVFRVAGKPAAGDGPARLRLVERERRAVGAN
jgi:hypothetical protein